MATQRGANLDMMLDDAGDLVFASFPRLAARLGRPHVSEDGRLSCRGTVLMGM